MQRFTIFNIGRGQAQTSFRLGAILTKALEKSSATIVLTNESFAQRDDNALCTAEICAYEDGQISIIADPDTISYEAALEEAEMVAEAERAARISHLYPDPPVDFEFLSKK